MNLNLAAILAQTALLLLLAPLLSGLIKNWKAKLQNRRGAPVWQPYFATTIRFDSHVEEVFERQIYRPGRILILRASRRIRRLQAGSIHAYLLYIFITLLLLLMFAT